MKSRRNARLDPRGVRRVQPAGEIVAELAGGAETLLTTVATGIVH